MLLTGNKIPKVKIVFVTSGQPSANPRLVKEATALSEAGYRVTVIYCPLSPWADNYDEKLFENNPHIKWIRVGWHPIKEKSLYRWARLRSKIYRLVWKIAGNLCDAAIRSMVLYSQVLKKEVLKHQAALYIGHNLGALPAVVKAAQKYQAKAAFDFEDYHRGENPPHSIQARLIQMVEEKYVPHLSYATAAAPLIAAEYKKHFPQLPIHTINNCFPAAYAANSLSELPHRPLKLFWFSQYIGKNRGLEQVIAAIGRTGDTEIELTLLGNTTPAFREYLLKVANNNLVRPNQVHFMSPVAEAAIVQVAAEHHIGLAVEVPHIRNRELCLTNKIFMYLLAGNAILFSNTPAQQQFLEQHPGIGTLFANGDVDRLADILKTYVKDASLLNTQRNASYVLGQQFNWDTEKQQFLKLVEAHI